MGFLRIVSKNRQAIYLKESNLNETVIAKIRKLNNLALQRGQTLAEMSLSWLLAQDVVTSVLIGASKAEQILRQHQGIRES